MIRINKMVSRLLKMGYQFYSVDVDPEEMQYAEVWVKDVIGRVISDPAIDLIASRYGMTGDEILDDLNWYITIKETNYDEETDYADEPYAKMSYSPATNTVVMEVGVDLMEIGGQDELISSILHELDHAARDESVGVQGHLYWDFEGWITNPAERDAVKSQIEAMFNNGYTAEEILIVLWDDWNNRWLPPEEQAKAIEITERLIEEARNEMTELV